MRAYGMHHLTAATLCAGGAMGSADEVNIQASELNRTMKVLECECSVATLHRVKVLGSSTDEAIAATLSMPRERRTLCMQSRWWV